MRRKEKEIADPNQIDQIIQNCDVCRIALSKDNTPYLLPISFGYNGICIYFHTALVGKKIDYITQNNKVCFEFEKNVKLVTNDNKACNWSFKYESVIGYGTIEELQSVEDKTNGLAEIMKQYSGRGWTIDVKSLNSTRVWKIVIDSMTGKHSI